LKKINPKRNHLPPRQLKVLRDTITRFKFKQTQGSLMPLINKYVNIDTVEREAKKDLIDRHSPFITVAGSAKKGEMLAVNVKMGQEYTHPDDFDHYIESITLFNGETKLAMTTFVPGTLGNEKSHAEVTFNIRPMGKKLTLVAHGYCTKHGIWESTPVEVEVEEASSCCGGGHCS
jgi:superoxide reductase